MELRVVMGLQTLERDDGDAANEGKDGGEKESPLNGSELGVIKKHGTGLVGKNVALQKHNPHTGKQEKCGEDLSVLRIGSNWQECKASSLAVNSD